MKPNFVDHISLMVRDLSKTEEFYSKFLSEPILRNDNLVVYKIGDARLYFKLSPKGAPSSDYDKDNVGINHIGFGVRTIDELKEFGQLFSGAGIKHSQLKIGRFGNEYIWLDDPNGIRLEIYHRSEE